MSEPSRCIFCNEGFPLWIHNEADLDKVILKCSVCPASGEYHKNVQPKDTPGFMDVCSWCGMSNEYHKNDCPVVLKK